MRQTTKFYGLIFFVMAIVVAQLELSRASTTNLLVNPQFDPPLSPRFDACDNRIANELLLPAAWEPYFKCKQPGDPGDTNLRPEYGLSSTQFFPERVRSAETALKYFNFWAINESAGVYQIVKNVKPAAKYRFGIWVQLWTSDCDLDKPNSWCEPGELQARACIDTDGGAFDPNGANTVCGEWSRERAWDRYAFVFVDAAAQASEITVALNTNARWAVKHNDAYADDASLVELESPPINFTPVAKTWLPVLSNGGPEPLFTVTPRFRRTATPTVMPTSTPQP
jgi:hypothetical protein